MGDLLQPPGSRDAVVTAEGEQHASRGRDRGQGAERHRDGDARAQELARGGKIVLERLEDGVGAAEVVRAQLVGIRLGQVRREERGQVRQVRCQGKQEDVARNR